jgi:penicillin-binding protein 1A
MSDVLDTPTELEPPNEPLPFRPPRRRWRRRGDGRPPKPRLRKLRFFSILIGLGTLALISTLFGMMMAVASDLPQLENKQQYRLAANSYLYDDHWRPIGLFAPPNHVVIDTSGQIAQSMKYAIVSIEDKRFFTDPGVDIRGIARAFIADVTGGARQGASTIAQQFVKNALAEQGNRTILEKVREAALAYHLTREWSKQKILTEYLNSIYFGNGAYGVESAARVYFGKIHGFDQNSATDGNTQPGCGDPGQLAGTVHLSPCASVLAPWESALLAGMVANPSAFDPIAHPHAALERRNLVLRDMLEQHYITEAQYEQGIRQPLPTANDIEQPAEPSAAPYFTSWLRPQILAAMGLGRGVPARVAEYRSYYGGLKIRTSLDLEMQKAAEQAVSSNLPSGSGLPTASLVAIDNRTGEVRAMVGGPIVNGAEDYSHYPFNLATEGYRQPGSAFKPFTLATALESGKYTPYSIIDSAPQNFVVPGSGGREHFIVHNFGNTYSGPITLTQATTISDNSVYSQVGINTGTKRIARLAKRMGIRSPVSSNYAMILGGLKQGVSPLDMAHAYETFAQGGRRVFSQALGAPEQGPTGLAQIQCLQIRCGGKSEIFDHPTFKRIIPASIAQTVHSILTTVVQSGTGTSAAISGVDVAGKTGTTTNYGDAWFVGWTPEITTAVWVGFPNKLVPMTTDFNGGPVEGGTYPAIIWHNFMTQALQIMAGYRTAKANKASTSTSPQGAGTTAAPSPSPSGSAAGSGTSQTPSPPTGAGGGGAANSGNAGGGNAGGGGGTAGAGVGGGPSAGGGNSGSGAGSGANSGSGSGSGSGAGSGSGSAAGSGGGTGGAGIGGG